VNLTTNFSLNELTFSDKANELGINNSPSAYIVINLNRLANKLEEVRLLFGKAIYVSSGYRCLKLNRAIGSKDTSQHVLGCAADFHINGYTPKQIIAKVLVSGIEFDQIIEEHLGGRSWVHISIPDQGKKCRKQSLIIDKHGTRSWAK